MIETITPAKWREFYWERPYPSITALAHQLGLPYKTVRRHLKAAGLTLRTAAEQRAIERRLGRHKPGGFHAWDEDRRREVARRAAAVAGANPYRRTAQIRQRMSEAAGRRVERRTVPCAWCGSLLVRLPCQLDQRRDRQPRYSACDRSCRMRVQLHERHHPGEPRPLIVARLVDVLKEERFRGMPRSGATVEKAGAVLGATDTEQAEVMACFLREGDR